MSTTLITGASSGIGWELAKIHAASGGDLVLVARNIRQMEKLKTSILQNHSVQIHLIEKDLSKDNAAEELYEYVKAQEWDIDILINNAGFGYYGMFMDTPLQKDEDMIQLNLLTLTKLTKLFASGMIQRGYGRIMNVASTAAFQPGPTMAVYCATKAYVLHFSEAIASELETTGVTITAFCPGATATAFMSVANMEESALVKDKKLPSASEVANYGYRAMMNGKRVAIHGVKNSLMVFGLRFTPRNLVTKVARMVLKKK
jgi:short-subunit dehydrogenase